MKKKTNSFSAVIFTNSNLFQIPFVLRGWLYLLVEGAPEDRETTIAATAATEMAAATTKDDEDEEKK